MFEQAESLLIFAFLAALLPFAFALSTAYLKINIVFSLVRNALGAQQVPSGMIIIALSISLTCMVMQPVFESSVTKIEQIDFTALDGRNLPEIKKTFQPALDEWREFLLKHAGEKEVNTLREISKQDNFFTLLTAFVLSELKEAFYMGFIMMMPFLLLDFIIANFLAALGMYMFSPILIALPLKILMIVVFDFWNLIFQSLFYSYA